jgi:hypothetical protein
VLREKNRKVLWRWDVPEEFMNGYLSAGSIGGQLRQTLGWERFLPVLLSVPPDKMSEKVSKQFPQGIETLYCFDSIKGITWKRDLLPLLEKKFRIAGIGTIADGSSSIVIATSDQVEEMVAAREEKGGKGGTRVIILDGKGAVISITDIIGVFIEHFERNSSMNSFRGGGFVISIDGKPFKGDSSNVSLFIDRNGTITRLVDEKGDPSRGRIVVFPDDTIAYSSFMKVAWDLKSLH